MKNIFFLLFFCLNSILSFKFLIFEVDTTDKRIEYVLDEVFIKMTKKDRITIRLFLDLMYLFLIDKKTKEVHHLKRNAENKEVYKDVEDIVLQFITRSKEKVLTREKARRLLKSPRTIELLDEIIERNIRLGKRKYEKVVQKNIKENEELLSNIININNLENEKVNEDEL